MDKDEAKAILIANLKGSKSKRTPLLTIAEAVRLLINDKEYGSSSKVAESFGVKRQTIEAFEKMIPVLEKGLKEEGNDFNPSGPINVGLIIEDLIKNEDFSLVCPGKFIKLVEKTKF